MKGFYIIGKIHSYAFVPFVQNAGYGAAQKQNMDMLSAVRDFHRASFFLEILVPMYQELYIPFSA